MSEVAFAKALRVFSRSHTSAAESLRIAIDVYMTELRAGLVRLRAESLEINMADTDRGPNTALVFTGFKDAAEINSFVQEFIYASRK